MLVSEYGVRGYARCTCRYWGKYRAVGTIVISAHLTGLASPTPKAESGRSLAAGAWPAGVFREVLL